MASPCPSDETLSLLDEGRLSDDVRREVLEHVEHCDGCRRTLAALARLSAGKADPQVPSRYRVLRELGRGAVGIVLLAEDTVLGRKVALKLVRDTKSEAGTLLLRESRAIARLSHRNVVTIHDVVVEEGWGFIAMEYVEGGTLASWLERDRPVEEVLAVFEQAARGLAAAHRAGVVHRDFKPANVLLGNDGRVCVSDFGLARVQDDPLLATLTATGGLVGTPAYMAPEQFDGRPPTPATDQFGFFVALHEALGRSRPFEGTSIESVKQAVRNGRRRVPAREIPRALSGLIDRGLQLEPEARFPSMDAVADLLAARRAPQRNPAVVIGAVVAGLLVIGGVGLLARRAPSCPPLTGRESVWTASQRDAVGAALASDGETKAAVVTALDETASSLDAAWAASCAEERPIAQRAREQLCLADVLSQLEVAIQTLAAVPPEIAPRALPVVRTLPEPKACAKLEALTERRPPPNTEPERTLAREARVLLLEAEALRRLSRYSEALDRVHQAKERATTARDRWLVADAMRLDGRLQNNVGDYPKAEKVLTDAVAAARETGDDVLLGRTAFSLAFVECLNQFHPEHCESATHLLEEAANRRPVDELRASLAEMRSARAGLRYDLATSLAQQKLAVEAWRGVPQSMEDQLRAQGTLILALQGDFFPAEALDELQRLHAIAVNYWGPNHARVIQLENLRPRLLISQGHLSEAEAVLAKTRARVTTYLGPTSAEFADTLSDESMLLEARGHPVESLAVLEPAAALRPELSFRIGFTGLLSRLGKRDELARLRAEMEAELDWRHRPATLDDVPTALSLLDTYEGDSKTVSELLAWVRPLFDQGPLSSNQVVLAIPAIEFELRRKDLKAAGADLQRARRAFEGRTDATISAELDSFQAELALATGDAKSAISIAEAALARTEKEGRRDAAVGSLHLVLAQALRAAARQAEGCDQLREAATILEPLVMPARVTAKAELAKCR